LLAADIGHDLSLFWRPEQPGPVLSPHDSKDFVIWGRLVAVPPGPRPVR